MELDRFVSSRLFIPEWPSRVTGIVGRSLKRGVAVQKKFISNNKYWCKPF